MRALGLIPYLLLGVGCATTAENAFNDDGRERATPRPEGRLEGRVYEFRDPETALKGARVQIANQSALTDVDGAFVFDGLRDGEAELSVSLAGHATVKEPLTLPSRDVVRVGLHSTGKLLVELPTAPGAEAKLVIRKDGVDETRFNGELLDGSYSVTVELARAGDCRWKRALQVEVDLVDGEQRKLDFKFDPPMTLSGEVKDPKKKPVAGAKVLASRVFEQNSLLRIAQDETVGWLEESRCVTDALGRFTLEGLDPGKYHLLVYSPAWAPQALDFEAGEQRAAIVMAPPEKAPGQ